MIMMVTIICYPEFNFRKSGVRSRFHKVIPAVATGTEVGQLQVEVNILYARIVASES